MRAVLSTHSVLNTRFEFRDFAKVFALAIVLFALFTGLVQFIPNPEEILAGFHPSVSFLIQYLIQFVILFLPLWIFVVDKYAASLADFGFQKIRLWPLIKTVLLCYFFYFVLSFLVALILYYTGITIPGYEEQQSYLPLFGYDPFGFTAAILTVAVIAPFLEELFFRGFVYRVFTKTWPVWLGSILTALLFAGIHFQVHTIIPLFILGLILNYSYQKTGSVWTAVVFHSLNNTIAFGLDLYLYFHPELLEELQMLS